MYCFTFCFNRISTGNYLQLAQKIQINDMLEDPMFAVVFILEYAISEPISDEDRKVCYYLYLCMQYTKPFYTFKKTGMVARSVACPLRKQRSRNPSSCPAHSFVENNVPLPLI